MVQKIVDVPEFTTWVAKRAIRFPTLETILMIEKFLYENRRSLGTRYQIWKRLPRKVMYQTYLLALAYLEYSGKIIIDRKGQVAWTWNPELVRRYLKRKDLAWEPPEKAGKREV